MYKQVLVAVAATVFGLMGAALAEPSKPPAAAAPEAVDPAEVSDRLGRHLDGLLDQLILLSLQPGNGEDENKAVSEKIDAVHEDAIQLYDDLNRTEDSHEALAPFVKRYLAIRDRATVLISAHGPIDTQLPAPFAAMNQDVEQVIARVRREIHGDEELEASREKAISDLHLEAAELRDDLIWSGLRKRQEDVAELQARYTTVQKKSRELFP